MILETLEEAGYSLVGTKQRKERKVYLKQFGKLCTRESPNTKRRDQSSRVNTRRDQVEPCRAFARQQSCPNSGNNRETVEN
jgi:hypothetical protein